MKYRVRKLLDGQLSNASGLRKDGSHVHLVRCCDCGLKHLMQYTITKRGLRFRAWRLNHKQGRAR